MTMPAFTAEASFYQTKSHYQTRSGRQAFNPSAQMIRQVYPTAMRDEQIEIHDCPVGFIKVGEWPNMSCVLIPPGGAGGGGGGRPPGGGPDDGEPHGRGKGKDGKTPAERVGGRNCTGKDVGGDIAKAELDCTNKGTKDQLRTLICFDEPDGTVTPMCCYEDRKGKHIVCIHAEEVPHK